MLTDLTDGTPMLRDMSKIRISREPEMAMLFESKGENSHADGPITTESGMKSSFNKVGDDM